MTTRPVARCSIYDQRPKMCQDYPTVTRYIPEECTFWFDSDGVRHGECNCGVGACCAIPRRGGEPLAEALSSEVGGASCKYLMLVDEENLLEKEASVQDAIYSRQVEEALDCAED